MKKILFITNIMPFPGNSGGTIKTKRLLDGLIRKRHKIYLCFMDTNIEDKTDLWRVQYENLLAGFWRIYNGNNVRNARNMILSIVCGIPLNIYRNKNNEMHQLVNSILSKELVDVIIVDHLEMFQYVPRNYFDKTILHEHNAEYVIWSRYAKRPHSILGRAAIEFEAKRLERYEKKACKFVKKVMAAPQDILSISEEGSSAKFGITYHMGDDSILNLPELVFNRNQFNVLFIGTLTWDANIEGIRWFAEKVLPLIKKKYPDVHVNVIGKLGQDTFSDIKDRNIKFCGFVDSIEEYMKNTTVFICPLFFGSGMKLKLIEAMYRGLPFVTTKVGAESITIFDRENTYSFPYAGIVAENSNDFANAVISYYEDENKWGSSSKTGRLIAKREYLWKDEIERFNTMVDEFR